MLELGLGLLVNRSLVFTLTKNLAHFTLPNSLYPIHTILFTLTNTHVHRHRNYAVDPYLASQLQASAAGCASQLAYSSLRVIVPQEPNHPLLTTDPTPKRTGTLDATSSPMHINTTTMAASLSTPDMKASLMSPDLSSLTRPLKGTYYRTFPT